VNSRLPAVLSRVAEIRSQLRELGKGGQSPVSLSSLPLVTARDRETGDCPLIPRRVPGSSFEAHLNRATSGTSAPRRPPIAGDFDDLIRRAAAKHGVSADLVHAVVRAESDYDPRCTSSAGAMGLMQLMPGTARALGVTDPYDAAQNLDAGTRYLREQLDRFNDLTLALAAYNAGPNAVARYDGVPPYRETQAYVRRVAEYLAEQSAPADRGSQ